MNWLSKALEKKYKINNSTSLTESEIEDLIKDKIKQSHSLMNLFRHFGVNPRRLDKLQIVIDDLEDRYAETDGERMTLNKSLFNNGDFFNKYFFIIAHEIVHWLSRTKEEESYFNDPEETLGFCASIAYELEQGSDLDTIWKRIYPKVSWHFHNEHDAKRFFKKMTDKAKDLLNVTKETN